VVVQSPLVISATVFVYWVASQTKNPINMRRRAIYRKSLGVNRRLSFKDGGPPGIEDVSQILG